MPPTADTRERILEAASPLLYREGVRGVGVDALVAASGVAKATFYRHFPSKDLVVEAFLRRRDRLWRAWLEEEVDRRAAAGEDPLLAVFDALGDWFASDDFRGCAFINTSAEITTPGHPALAAVRDHTRLVREHLHRLSGGEVRDPEAIAGAIFLLVEGAIVTARIEGSPAAAAHARDAASALLAAHRQETP